MSPTSSFTVLKKNIAAYGKGYSDDIDINTFHRILNLYKAHDDPYIQHMLQKEKKLEPVLFAMARQQFYVQEQARLHDLVRALWLFAGPGALPLSSNQFRERYGLTYFEFAYLAAATSAKIDQNLEQGADPVLIEAQFLNTEIASMPTHAVMPFLRLSSKTRDEIRSMYSEARSKVSPLVHFQIRSSFLEFPLIDMEDGYYLAPRSTLLFKSAWMGPYRLSQDLPRFQDEISARFQLYVGELIAEYPGRIGPLIGDEALSEQVAGRSCDFLIETTELLILVECKAVMYTMRSVTDGAIRGSNFITKIRSGLDQLSSTAAAVRSGALGDLVRDPQKRMLGFVIVWGEETLLDDPSFRSSILSISDGSRDESQFCEPPEVISIAMLERIVALAKKSSIRIDEMVSEVRRRNYLITGAWHPYLDEHFTESILGKGMGLEVMDRSFHEFWSSVFQNVTDEYHPPF